MNHEPRTAPLLVEGVVFTLLLALIIVSYAIVNTPGIPQ